MTAARRAGLPRDMATSIRRSPILAPRSTPADSDPQPLARKDVPRPAEVESGRSCTDEIDSIVAIEPPASRRSRRLQDDLQTGHLQCRCVVKNRQCARGLVSIPEHVDKGLQAAGGLALPRRRVRADSGCLHSAYRGQPASQTVNLVTRDQCRPTAFSTRSDCRRSMADSEACGIEAIS